MTEHYSAFQAIVLILVGDFQMQFSHTCTSNPIGSQKFRFSMTKLLGLLRVWFVSAQQRFGSTCNFKPSESQPAWELHEKTPGPDLNECWKTGKVRNDEGGGEVGTDDGFCSKKETIPQKQEQGWQNKRLIKSERQADLWSGSKWLL